MYSARSALASSQKCPDGYAASLSRQAPDGSANTPWSSSAGSGLAMLIQEGVVRYPAPSDGSPPSFSVSLNPDAATGRKHMWSIHT